MADDTPMTDDTPQTLHDAMLAVAGELAETGIGKDQRNKQQGYNFRGIDDMLNKIAPLFVKYGIVMTVSYGIESIKDFERETQNGKARWTHAVLKGTFTFCKSKEFLTTITIGEGMDNADKACNKAMSAALKYALINTFIIPTVGTEDGDFHSPTVQDDGIINPIDVTPWQARIDNAASREDGERLWHDFTRSVKTSNDVDGYEKVKAYFAAAKEAKGWADSKDNRAPR